MKKFRYILATNQDIIDELEEQSFIKSCKVYNRKNRASFLDIHIVLKLSDAIFRRKLRFDDIHTILRPKMPLTITYAIKIKLL